MKRIENERTAEKKVTFTQDYNKKRVPDHGSEQWTRGQDFQRRNQNYNNDKSTRNFPHVIRISLEGQTLHMGITIRTMENHMINAQISHLVEAMDIDAKMDLSIIRMGTGETMGTSLVLHRLKEETIRKIVHTVSQEVISLTFLLSADLTIDIRLGLHPTNKNFQKTIT